MNDALNFTSKFFIVLLNVFGVPIKCRIARFFKYYFIYAFSFLTANQVLTLRERTTIIDISICLIFIFSGIYYNITSGIIYLKNRFIFAMYNMMNTDFADYSTLDIRSTNEKFRKFFFKYGILFCVTYSFSLLSPVLFFPLSGKQLGDLSTLIIPCKFPWTINTYPKYLLTVLLQLSWVGVLSVPVILNFMFVIYFMMEVRVQFEILNRWIKELDKSFVTWIMSNEKDVVLVHESRRFVNSFKHCIRRHQKILRYTHVY